MSKFATAMAATAVASAAVSADEPYMETMTVYQARASGDKPEWKNGRWESKYGYDSGLDTVNTASIQSALYYVQAESTQSLNQPLPNNPQDCIRKNNVQYITFYEMKIRQPDTGLAEFAGNGSQPIGYCPYATMDGGSVHIDDWAGNITWHDPKTSEAIFVDSCVGAQKQIDASRGEYPNNYWFSFPNSCPQKEWSDKDDECRKEFPGGLCEDGKTPEDGDCVFSYSILGYIDLDDLTGIKAMGYNNYTEFCMDQTNETSNNGIELKIEQSGDGYVQVSSIPFWNNSLDEAANENRTRQMMELYNSEAEKPGSNMTKLPEPESITNPPCWKEFKECYDAENGCKRTSWAQICEVCQTAEEGCEAKDSNAKPYPTLEKPKTPTPSTVSPDSSASPDSSGNDPSKSPDSSSSASSIAVGTASVVVATLLNVLI